MKNLLKLIGILLFITIAYLLLWPVDIEPVAFIPPPNPGFKGDYAKNDNLSNTRILFNGKGTGPEDIALGPDGLFFTGYEDGRIVKFSPVSGIIAQFANTGGRPLGMKFDTTRGALIVADEHKGLLSINGLGKVTVLTDEVKGTKINFADDLDIAEDGTIYFTDATQRNHDVMIEAWELQPTGRLLSYHPFTKETKVEMDSLRFANGIAIGPNSDYLLVNETFGMVTHKYWLKGKKKGESEIWKNDYPGFIDNITYNGKGTFWLAIPNKRVTDFEPLFDKPFLRKIARRLPPKLSGGVEPPPFGMVIGLDLEGNITHNFQDYSGKVWYVTSVNEFMGDLWIGSLRMEGIGRYQLN